MGYGFADFEACEAIAMKRSSENVFQTTFLMKSNLSPLLPKGRKT
ncbi:hypothetical protein HMPREF1051_2962 [Neisseria sicca VK64]|uniref:Uncharacterized protein n=1 Tax=Neisseria sicca VK64 TaxID=1095748 RepID=I2NUY9_NEISI|nr:hypothetical protein HMPREF1051_2962 [Neisseria sicca VK64]